MQKRMSGLERCQAALKHEIPDRIPVVPQTFMFACEYAGIKIGKANRDGRLMAKAIQTSWEKFGYDGCVIDFDDASLAEACGATVIFREEEPAIVDESKPLLQDLRELQDKKLPDPENDGRLAEWLKATDILISSIGEEAFIMGRADQGPFSLLCLLRGTENFLIEFLTEDPAVVKDALEWCRKACYAFARAQLDHGAHATSIGDAYAGPNLVSPKTYRQFAFEPERDLAQQTQEKGQHFSIHICGDTSDIIQDMAKTGAHILEVDWKVDMQEAKSQVSDTAVLMGNIDPSSVFAWGTPEDVDKLSKDIIEQTGGVGIFLSSGCALGRNSKPENVEALVNAAEKYGVAEKLRIFSREEGRQ